MDLMIMDDVEKIIAYLNSLGRYPRLIDKITKPLPSSVLFEILFANVFESNELRLDYEVNISPQNDSSVDFVHKEKSGERLCFELLSPEMSEELKYACTPKKTNVEGISEYSVLLEGGHFNKYLRPQAQTIRMQEKLLEKIDKFPDPTNDIFSNIVVDCSNFHFGHFDGGDCQMVMFGRTQNPFFQEYWNGLPIKGLLDNCNNSRGAKEFRERITSVIFIPETSIDLLEKAFIVLNECRPKEHLEKFRLKLKNTSIFQKIKYVSLQSV